MKLYRVTVIDHGTLDDRGYMQSVGPGTSVRAFTVRDDGNRFYRAQLKTLRENHHFKLRLEIVETPAMDSHLWTRYVEGHDIPLTVINVIAAASGPVQK